MLPALLRQEISRRTSPQNHRVLTAASMRQPAAITHHPKVPPGTVTQLRKLHGAIKVAIAPYDRLATSQACAKLAGDRGAPPLLVVTTTAVTASKARSLRIARSLPARRQCPRPPRLRRRAGGYGARPCESDTSS